MNDPKKPMENVQGETLDASALDGFVKIRDLIFFEGALLSHFRNPDGKDFLYLWSDCDESANRWTIFEVSEASIQKYLAGDVPLRDLMLNESVSSVMLVDLEDDLKVRSLISVAPELLPEAYVPDESSFYPESDSLRAD